MNKKLFIEIVIAVLILALAGLGGFLLFRYFAPGVEEVPVEQAEGSESLGEELFEKSQNPTEEFPATNPLEKTTNPFEKEETNPYGSYKNPFE